MVSNPSKAKARRKKRQNEYQRSVSIDAVQGRNPGVQSERDGSSGQIDQGEQGPEPEQATNSTLPESSGQVQRSKFVTTGQADVAMVSGAQQGSSQEHVDAEMGQGPEEDELEDLNDEEVADAKETTKDSSAPGRRPKQSFFGKLNPFRGGDEK